MPKRAILWCGQVKQPAIRQGMHGKSHKLRGSLLEITDEYAGSDDSKIQCNSLQLSFNAALALGVERNEIHACVFSDDLLPPSFDPGNNHPATVAGLHRLVRTLSVRAKPDDALLFIAVNHGNKSALATAEPVDELDDDRIVRGLTPAALDECLNQLGGSQVVVVSTCYAGIFLSLEKRKGRAVLVACSAEEVYLVPRQHCAWPPFLDELFGAWCACSLSDTVPRLRLPLEEAFCRAHERLTVEKAPNVPLREGEAEWPA